MPYPSDLHVKAADPLPKPKPDTIEPQSPPLGCAE